MRLLFISNNFPPEVNAPAMRLYEHARQWAKDGHAVDVLTSAPNFPEGKVYDGYKNRFGREKVDGIDVTRVPMYVTANQGTLKRTLSYISFMLSAIWHTHRVRPRPDVVVATSPQFFAAVAGYVVARMKRAPFVLEIRDLWPESIVAVGAIRRNAIIRFFERLEHFLYRKADHIVVVTEAFKTFIEDKGIPSEKITVIMNGADLSMWAEPLDPVRIEAMIREYDLGGRFVAAYVGTIGMAHRADILLEAAQKCTDPNIVFLVAGTGADRDALAEKAAALALPNFRLLDKQPREVIPYLLALTDASVVHLKDTPLFRTVIPSKIFEAMATGTPMVVGVAGETKRIVEQSGSGIPIPPEDVEALLGAVMQLKEDRAVYDEMSRCGRDYVGEHHDRVKLARRYWDVLEQVASDAPVEAKEKLMPASS